MHRIDNATAIPALPAPPPLGTPGYFTNGNRPVGLIPTRVDDNWLNSVQEEIANVVLAVGMQLSKTSNTQLYEAIQAIAFGANPDLSAYLPLTGGSLYRPGGSDILQMVVDQGQSARMLFNVNATRVWGIGTSSAGVFEIGDWVLGSPRLTINDAGTTGIHGALWVSGDADIAQNLSVQGEITATGSLRGWAALLQSDIIAQGSLQSVGATISGITHTDRILTNNDATIGTTLLVNSFATIDGAATVGGLLRANGNRILSYGGNNPSVAMVNPGAAPGFGMWVGGNPGRMSIGTADANGNPGTQLLRLDGSGLFEVLGGGLEVVGGINANGTLNIGGQCHFHADLRVNGEGTFDGTFRTGGDSFVGNNLVVSGTASKPGGGSWESPSDARLEKEVRDYERGLAEIRRLRPVAYQFNGLGGTRDDGKVYHGLVAQEVAEIMPEMIGEQSVKLHAEDAEDTTVLSLNSTALTFALVTAVKELAARLEALEA